MASPYRSPEVRDSTGRFLLYPAGERTGRRSGGAARIGLIGGALAAMTAGHPVAATTVLAATAAIGLWQWRRARGGGGLLLHVERGELAICEQRSGHDVLRVRLVDLKDVRLDTKSVRMVLPGPDAVPGVQFTHPTVGPELDVARIVLDIEGRHDVLRLTEAFLPHMDSMEWAGKIRTFLRSFGWSPVTDGAEHEAGVERDDDD